MDSLQLAIVADDPLARHALVALVSTLAGIELVIAVSGEGLLSSLGDELGDDGADVVLWDVGWEAPEFLPDWQEIEIPVLALLPDADVAVDSWAAGAQGLLSRDAEGEQLRAALLAVVWGLTVMDPSFAPPQPEELGPELDLNGDTLTPRELEVLQLLAEGLTNKAIGQQLGISDHTVKFHVNAILGKLGAQSRTDAVVRATRSGLLVL